MTMLLPKIKLKTIPSFPATILDGVGIDVVKQNGNYQFNLDFGDFGAISAIPTSPTSYVLTYDTVTGVYVLVPSHLLGGAVAGIADAPPDGTGPYGRQSAGWVLLPSVARAQRIVTASGAITALAGDDIVIVKKTTPSPTAVNVNWSIIKRPLTIVDGKGDAATNTITIIPAAGQTHYALANYPVVIDGNGGSVTLTPLADGSGAF